MESNGHTVPHLLDITAVISAVLGTLGGLYGSYALYPNVFRRLTAAGSTGVVAAVVSGLTVCVPALDVALFARPGLLSFAVGAIVWQAYAFFLFVDVAAPVFEEADDPKLAMIPQRRRSEMQPSDIAAWLWFRVAWLGGFGWAEITLLIAPEKGSIWSYIVVTMLLGGLAGIIFGYRAEVPAEKPPLFSFKSVASIVGVVTITLSCVILLLSLVLARFGHRSLSVDLPLTAKVILYIVITPIPILISAAGFAPAAQWKMSKLSDRAYGLIAIVLALLALLTQLVQPVTDMFGIHGL